ncbi:hypothetical protein F5B20DRAFT_117572 [Whalleya microplaca]|nr:hypothetical protein F5B20DRAFT_117572 [Whalleya microplaca]
MYLALTINTSYAYLPLSHNMKSNLKYHRNDSDGNALISRLASIMPRVNSPIQPIRSWRSSFHPLSIILRLDPQFPLVAESIFTGYARITTADGGQGVPAMLVFDTLLALKNVRSTVNSENFALQTQQQRSFINAQVGRCYKPSSSGARSQILALVEKHNLNAMPGPSPGSQIRILTSLSTGITLFPRSIFNNFNTIPRVDP